MLGHGSLLTPVYNHRSLGQLLDKAHQALSPAYRKAQSARDKCAEQSSMTQEESLAGEGQLHPGQELQVQKLGRRWCDGEAEEKRLAEQA